MLSAPTAAPRTTSSTRLTRPGSCSIFEGGGGCFSADTCAFDNQDQLYFAQSLATPEWLSERDGIFDFGDPRNPLAGYSFVYVPYCTGDIHVGNATTTYAPDVIVEHRGYPNGLIAVEHLASTYPAATEVVVTGISAGSAAAPLYAGLVADTLPEARIVSLADSSGGYPDIAALNGLVGSLWGTMAAVPDWPSTEGMTAREWSLPGLYGVVAAHAPETVFGKFDYAYDEAQVFYAGLAGLEADELLSSSTRTMRGSRRTAPRWPSTSRLVMDTPSSAATRSTTSRWRACASSIGSPSSSRAWPRRTFAARTVAERTRWSRACAESG